MDGCFYRVFVFDQAAWYAFNLVADKDDVVACIVEAVLGQSMLGTVYNSLCPTYLLMTNPDRVTFMLCIENDRTSRRKLLTAPGIEHTIALSNIL